MKTKDIAGSASASASRAERSEAVRNDSTRTEANLAQVTRAEVTRAEATRGEPAPHTNAATARGANVDWRAVLAGASPREVLARLVNADVFELRPRVARALAERCYLLDGDFVYLRCIARIARFATRYRGEPSLDVWLAEQVDAALLDALERADARGDACGDACGSQDAGRDDLSRDGGCGDAAGGEGGRGSVERTAALGAPPKASHAAQRSVPKPVAPTFVDLARPLGLDPERMRDVCSAFNRCAPLERAAFFGVVLERGDLESVAARLGVAPAHCARAARQALERCMERATAGPASSRGAEASRSAAAQVAPGAAPGADESAVETARRDAGREFAGDVGVDVGFDVGGDVRGDVGCDRGNSVGKDRDRDADERAPGRPSPATPDAMASERRAAPRGPVAVATTSSVAAPSSSARSTTHSSRAAASGPVGGPLGGPLGGRDELRARSAAASDAIRSSVETAAAGGAVQHARGAERRSTSRGERGEAR